MNAIRARILVIGMAWLCAPRPALAAVRHVPAQHPTIQAAVLASSHGDEILVAPGVYNEMIRPGGRNLVIRSTQGPDVTILDGTGLSNSIYRCENGESAASVLEGFTLRNGFGLGAGAIQLVGGASPRIINCTMRDNRTACLATNSAAQFLNCRFYDNVNGALSGGGGLEVIGCEFVGNSGSVGGGIGITGTATYAHCVFRDNMAPGSGGVMSINAGVGTIVRDCLFEGNTSGNRAGAVWATVGQAAFLNCTFRGNSSVQRGGAIYVTNAFDITIDGCRFEGNSTDFYGGAVASEGAASRTLIRDCVFVGNAALVHGSGGGAAAANSTIRVERSVFEDNIAQTGGGLASLGDINFGAAEVIADRCTFRGNLASTLGGCGGAVGAFGGWGRLTLTNCLMDGNESEDRGGAISVSGPTSIANCTLVNNCAETTGGTIHDFGSFGPILITNSVVWNNTTKTGAAPIGPLDSFSVKLNVAHSVVQGGFEGEGNLAINPMLASLGFPADVRLSPGSPCIDAGDPATDLPEGADADYFGNPRLSGSTLDIGAHEFAHGATNPACPADLDGDGFVGFADLNAVVSQYHDSGAGLAGDIDGDGVVGFADLSAALAAFGTACP